MLFRSVSGPGWSALTYAGRYWATHVTRSGMNVDDELRRELEEFFNIRFLQWIEYMSLIGSLDAAVGALLALEAWSKVRDMQFDISSLR